MDRFETLSCEYFEGHLEAHEAAELASILRNDPQKKRQFLEMYQQNRLLAVDLASGTEEDLARKVLAEIEGDTRQFVKSVMRGVQAPKAAQGRGSRKAGRAAALGGGTGVWIWAPFAAGAAALAILGAWSYFLVPPPAPPRVLARLEASTGEISLSGVGPAKRSIHVGESLDPGQTLESIGPESSAVLVYPDHTRLELGGGTSLRILPDPRSPQGKTLELLRGFLRSTVSRQPKELPLLIQARWAEVRVLGTKFDLHAEAESTRLDVTEGRVRFARTQQTNSPASQGVEVGPGEWAASTRESLVRWTPVCDLDFSRMKELPSQMEAVFCSSKILHTRERKIVPAPDRVRFERGGLVFDPVPGETRDHGLVVARWKEEVGDDIRMEAEIAGGSLWSIGFAVSGDSFEGYRVIFAIRENPGGIMIDTISPVDFVPLASDPRPIAFEKNQAIKVEKVGKRVKVWVDQELRIDTVIDHPLSEGRRKVFAISNFGESPVVRSLRVWRGTNH
jgi:hypothetical protein